MAGFPVMVESNSLASIRGNCSRREGSSRRVGGVMRGDMGSRPGIKRWWRAGSAEDFQFTARVCPPQRVVGHRGEWPQGFYQSYSQVGKLGFLGV